MAIHHFSSLGITPFLCLEIRLLCLLKPSNSFVTNLLYYIPPFEILRIVFWTRPWPTTSSTKIFEKEEWVSALLWSCLLLLSSMPPQLCHRSLLVSCWALTVMPALEPLCREHYSHGFQERDGWEVGLCFLPHCHTSISECTRPSIRFGDAGRFNMPDTRTI